MACISLPALGSYLHDSDLFLVLYSTYITVFAVMSPALGAFADKNDDPRVTLVYIGVTQFTILAAVLFCSTLVPKGALEFNPRFPPDEDSNEQGEWCVGRTGWETRPPGKKVNTGTGVT